MSVRVRSNSELVHDQVTASNESNSELAYEQVIVSNESDSEFSHDQIEFLYCFKITM